MSKENRGKTLEAQIRDMARTVGVPEELHPDYQKLVLTRLHDAAIIHQFPSTAVSGNVPEEDARIIRKINAALRQSPTVPQQLRHIVDKGGVPHERVWIDGKLNPIFTADAETAEAHKLRGDGVRALARAVIDVKRIRERYKKEGR